MNVDNYLPWLLPIALLILLAFRFSASSPKHDSPVRSSKKINLSKFIFLLVFVILIVLLGQRFLVNRPIKCPTAITPEMLSKMVTEDLSYVAGVFYEKKFGCINYEKGSVKVIKFTLLKNPDENKNVNDSYTWEKAADENKITEFAFTKSDYPHCIFYVIKDAEKYNEYCSYLFSLADDNFLLKDILKKIEPSSGFVKFKNCVFKIRGFNMHEKGFVFKIQLKSDCYKKYVVSGKLANEILNGEFPTEEIEPYLTALDKNDIIEKLIIESFDSKKDNLSNQKMFCYTVLSPNTVEMLYYKNELIKVNEFYFRIKKPLKISCTSGVKIYYTGENEDDLFKRTKGFSMEVPNEFNKKSIADLYVWIDKGFVRFYPEQFAKFTELETVE